MTEAKELAARYIEQLDAWTNEGRWIEQPVNALWEWERWICEEPERAWPVFEEIVALRSDDETLYQVASRLRILLHQDFDAFHERAERLVRSTPRFARIVGEGFFDRQRYEERPFDVEELIRAHEEMHRNAGQAHRVDGVIRADPRRGFDLAVEIIHRGPSEGMDSFDTFSPLWELLRHHGAAVIDRMEEVARGSYLVRRALWRMIPQQRGATEGYGIDDAIWPRVVAAQGQTTDFTDDTEPRPAPRQLGAEDEQLLKAWFAYEHNFWSFEAMDTLIKEEPDTAWAVFLEMLRRTDNERYIGVLAAGPLENMMGPDLFDRIAAEARTNRKLRRALRGVWLSDDDEIQPRFDALMKRFGQA